MDDDSASPSSCSATTANSTQQQQEASSRHHHHHLTQQRILMQQNDQQIQAEQMFLLALQERLTQQLSPPQNDFQRIWQSVMLGLPAILPPQLSLTTTALPGTSQPLSHPLFQHNLCAWPQCDTPCENFTEFIHHISAVHTLDERTAQQCRSQIELVDGLEHRLIKERERLQAMMQHLHMKQSPDTTTPSLGNVASETPLTSPTIVETKSEFPPCEQHTPVPATSMANTSMASVEEQRMPIITPRRRISDKSVLPISADISRNREFYRTHDVRPPYTYASLIRQAIMESKDCQLTLNEIYQWFTETFAYFRRNAATWKNAVRHNLSLHKCFARVEQNVKGAVWTVDDSEFYRRRPQRAHASRSSTNAKKLGNPLNLLSTAAAASVVNVGAAVEDVLKQENLSNITDELTDDSHLANMTCASDDSDESPKDALLSTSDNGVAALNTATSLLDRLSSPNSANHNLNCDISRRALDLFIKEEDTSPKLIVHEEFLQ